MERLALLVLLALGACDVRPLEPDHTLSGTLALISVVTPGDSLQWVDIRGFDAPLDEVVASLTAQGPSGRRAASGEEVLSGPSGCVGLEGATVVGAWTCRVFRLAIGAGDSVTVAARTPTAEPVWGSTLVPGDFTVMPPSPVGATRSVRISWTESASARSYLVTVHDADLCPPIGPCPGLLVRRVEGLETTVDTRDFVGHGSPFVSVQALDEHLDTYATTGVAGGTFSTLPISSVHGGLGVVGARVVGSPSRVYLDR